MLSILSGRNPTSIGERNPSATRKNVVVLLCVGSAAVLVFKHISNPIPPPPHTFESGEDVRAMHRLMQETLMHKIDRERERERDTTEYSTTSIQKIGSPEPAFPELQPPLYAKVNPRPRLIWFAPGFCSGVYIYLFPNLKNS